MVMNSGFGAEAYLRAVASLSASVRSCLPLWALTSVVFGAVRALLSVSPAIERSGLNQAEAYMSAPLRAFSPPLASRRVTARRIAPLALL